MKHYKFAIPIKITKIIDQQQDANFVGFFKPGSGKAMFQRASDNEADSRTYEIIVHAVGKLGHIILEPHSIDLETVSIGFTKTMNFSISNVTETALYLKLKLESQIPAP